MIKYTTEAPWFVEVHQDSTTVESKYFTVAVDVSNDDAHLIAAAPELLRTVLLCRDLIDSLKPLGEMAGFSELISTAVSSMDLVIKKAEGK